MTRLALCLRFHLSRTMATITRIAMAATPPTMPPMTAFWVCLGRPLGAGAAVGAALGLDAPASPAPPLTPAVAVTTITSTDEAPESEVSVEEREVVVENKVELERE